MTNLLIADGDADARLLMRLALSAGTGFAIVAEVTDGRDAVAQAVRARDAGTPPELALLDCDLLRPGADAFDALPALREAVPACRIILRSGYGDDDLRRVSRAAGALGWLRKDTPASRLATELAALGAVVGVVQDVLDATSTRLAGDLRSAGKARRFVTDALDRWGVGELAEVVMLLVSEVVTNAVVHARSATEVSVRLTPDAARVEVSDDSGALPVTRTAQEGDESGRGMAIVESLSRAWGVCPRAGGGKTIWFEVDRPRVGAPPSHG